MRPQSRPEILFFALAGLAVLAIAASYALGLFGPVVWRGIDAGRLLAPVMCMAVLLLLFRRAARGQIPWRFVLGVCAVSFFPMGGILSNSGNPVVQASACAVMVLAAAMAAASLFLNRKAKATVA